MFIIFFFNMFLLCIEMSHETVVVDGLRGRMQSLRDLCPYNKFCGSNPLKKIERPDHEPCCEQCSCASDCFETGSCCPDIPLSGPAGYKFPCKHLWDFGNVPADQVRPRGIYYWYHVVDGCPKNEQAHSYQKCFEQKDIHDFVIVSDTKTGKLYRNKHCAHCNGIQDYIKLQLRITCKDVQYKYMFSLTTAVEREKYVMENCSLTSLPPDMRVGMSNCLPKKEVVSACNSSGKWDAYDNEIEKGCMTQFEDQNMVFRAPILKDGLIEYYANVFCFLCNVPSNTEKTDSCEIVQTNVNEKFNFVNLYAVLDDKMWGKEDEVVAIEAACSSTQIWDPYSKLCRQLFCPKSQIPVYGSCNGYFNKINGYIIAIHFKVNIEDQTIVIGSSIFNILKNMITRKLGNDITCGICRTSLFSGYTSTSELYVRQEIFTTDDCPYDTLLKRLRRLAIEKEVHVKSKYGGQVIRIVMVLIFEEIKESTGYKKLIDSRSTFCPPFAEVVKESILLYCPTIELPKHVVYGLGLDNTSDTSSISKQTNQSESLLQHICVHSYFLAKEVNLASANSFTISYLCKLLLLVIISLC